MVPKKCVEGKSYIPSRCICHTYFRPLTWNVSEILSKNCKKRESNLTPSNG